MFSSQHSLKNIRDEHEQKQFLCDTFRNFGWDTQNILNRIPESDDLYFDAITQVKMNSWTKKQIALVFQKHLAARSAAEPNKPEPSLSIRLTE